MRDNSQRHCVVRTQINTNQSFDMITYFVFVFLTRMSNTGDKQVHQSYVNRTEVTVDYDEFRYSIADFCKFYGKVSIVNLSTIVK